jgi:hypothetical protein
MYRNEKIQPERTGDGRGRTESRKLTPLEGAPTVPGINGPDPQIVGVAEQYAADNGIDLKRQSEFIVSFIRAEILTEVERNAVQQAGREGLRNAVQEAK